MRRPGYETLDANEANGPDYLASIPPLPEAVRAQRWQVVEWIHGITSVYPWDAVIVLEQVRECLAPDGVLVLEQPNALEAARYVYIGDVRHLFGDPSFRNPLHMNRWAYTPDTLTDLVLSVGFGDVRILPARSHVPARDFRIEARL